MLCSRFEGVILLNILELTPPMSLDADIIKPNKAREADEVFIV